MQYKKISTVAKEKGCSRASVYQAIANGKLNRILIDGTPYVTDDEKYREWRIAK